MRYTRKKLEKKETLATGFGEDLKIETKEMRVWLERGTGQISVERWRKCDDGRYRWRTTETYNDNEETME